MRDCLEHLFGSATITDPIIIIIVIIIIIIIIIVVISNISIKISCLIF